jgi:hypothetical protein
VPDVSKAFGDELVESFIARLACPQPRILRKPNDRWTWFFHFGSKHDFVGHIITLLYETHETISAL